MVVGGLSFSIDTCLYFSGLQIGLSAAFSKTISFSAGMVFSFLLNRKYTFQTVEAKYGKFNFIAIYGISLSMNICINSFLLGQIDDSLIPLEWVAFLTASLISVVFNFFGLKYVVFRK